MKQLSSNNPNVVTPLLPHQQRLIEKLRASHGLLAAWGTGSGKTLGSIAAAVDQGRPLEVIAPASLLANYQKELDKHLETPLPDVRIRSYEKAVRDQNINPESFAVLDEAHRIRNRGTLTHEHVAKAVQAAKARLLLSATPVFNQPHDIANLLNTAAGHDVLPGDPTTFKNEFVGEKLLNPSLLNRLRGMKPVAVPVLKNKAKLINAASGYVDVHKGGGENFPERIDESYDVPMSAKQHDVYKFLEGKLPWYLRVKIRSGLPMSKSESQELNAFQGGLRQASNTPRPYVDEMSDDEEGTHVPKIQKMVEHLQQMRGVDPNHRGVLYSNYLNGGLHPLSRQLIQAKIPHSILHGGVSKPARAQMVQDYNSGKIPTLLISAAGTEGLDLKGTKSIQHMDQHWHESRAEQINGRGIRFQSHAHLPKAERKVRVMRYFSSHPESFANKIGIGKPGQGIERYMKNMADTKAQMGNQIMGAMQEASDMGPLKQPAMKAACSLYGVKLAALSPAQAGLLSALAGAVGAGGGAAATQDHPTFESVAGPALGGALVAGAVGYGATRHGLQAASQAATKAHALKSSDLLETMRRMQL